MKKIENWQNEFEKLFHPEVSGFDLQLSKKEEMLLEMRNSGKTLEEVGRKFSVTRERVRQIEAKIQEKLRVKTNIKDFITRLLENKD